MRRKLMCRAIPALALVVAARLSAATPTITSFTTSNASPIQGSTFSLCWTVGNAPTSITITPGITGDQTTTYVDSTNPTSGCATFTTPIARLRADGDSLTCGFRSTGAAQNAPASGFLDQPCSPNPNPNGSPQRAWPVRAKANLEQLGYSVPVYTNLGITGTLAAGHTPITCASTIYNPDILLITFGANDLQGAAGNSVGDTLYTNLKTLWAAAKATPCTVVIGTVTPRTSLTDSIRQYTNGQLLSVPSLFHGAIDFGNLSDVMACSGCNVSAVTYYNSDNTHYTDLGYQHEGDLASAILAPLMFANYTITATNGLTSAPTSLHVTVKRQNAAIMNSGITR